MTIRRALARIHVGSSLAYSSQGGSPAPRPSLLARLNAWLDRRLFPDPGRHCGD